MKAKKVLKGLGKSKAKEFNLVTVRFTPKELATLKRKARKWAKGNQTVLLKYAVLNFKPTAADLVDP